MSGVCTVRMSILGSNASSESARVDAQRLEAVALDVRVERDDVHPERARARRDLAADASQPDDAERPPVDLRAEELAAIPASGAHRVERVAAGGARTKSDEPKNSSATAMVLPLGALMTAMPSVVAAPRSMLSVPTPARPMTRSFFARRSSSAGSCVALRPTNAS